MNVGLHNYRTIWLKDGDPSVVNIIDQRKLPHEFAIEELTSVAQFALAIKDMQVRGAGLIGATAGFGMYIAALTAPRQDPNAYIYESAKKLIDTRPTAANLTWAVNRQLTAMKGGRTLDEKIQIALHTALAIADEDARYCKQIGEHGVVLIEEISKRKSKAPVNILTHCNAGWLAFVDHGSATSPVYEAQRRGIEVHVWVDETRPRNQGAALTCWELINAGVPHTLIVDNAGGHLMQHGMVDIVIVGSDRTTRTGDVANKIGTYLKALAAKDNDVPFYVALPSSTIDWETENGITDIPIEERDSSEIKHVYGALENGKNPESILICPDKTPAKNYAFDVTPAHLVTGLITERGICKANAKSILQLFPEQG